MGSTFKMLAARTIPTDAAPVTVYTPPRGGCAVIGRISVVSCWPTLEAQGYEPVRYTSDLVNFVRYGENQFSFGKAATGATQNHYQWGLLSSNRDRSLSLQLMQADEKGIYGTYSLFEFISNGQSITGLAFAPEVSKTLFLDQAIPLGDGQSLIVRNGITTLNNGYIWKDRSELGGPSVNFDSVIAEHRKRASHLKLVVFGQEFTEEG